VRRRSRFHKTTPSSLARDRRDDRCSALDGYDVVMSQPGAKSKGPPNPYLRVLLSLSVVLVGAGLGYVLIGRLTGPRGFDLLATNVELSALLFGNSLGWGTIGLGILGIMLWLAVQGVRRR